MKSATKKIKVLVAMSGGVDSSVAAAILVASQKYDVTGAYMVNYDDPTTRSLQGENASTACWLPDYRDALRVAAHLGIPLIKLNFTKEYKAQVLDYMYREYEAGRTPNPDVLCNKFIKFGSWLDEAQKRGFDFLATGHYANIKIEKNKNTKIFKLLEAKDKNKDQTYFLHQLNQAQLARTLFPIGGYTKPQIRKLAKKFKLPTADKEESMGICFVGEVPMKEFLEKKIKRVPGNIVLSVQGAGGKSVVLGKHHGLAFYTMGQRSGLSYDDKIAGLFPVDRNNRNEPLYVVGKNEETNELIVGYENDPALYKKEIVVKDVNFINGQRPKLPLQCQVRLRHRQALQSGRLKVREFADGSSGMVISFTKPQRAVTPGQFAVFYKKGECLGGGVINNY